MSDAIEATAVRVLRQYPVQRAALFGSAARGDMNPDSDIDMLVEAHATPPYRAFKKGTA
ncbi:MAG: nucleotidyltransferase domain-containing protein [Oscillospiraceae bacterium]|nr:nucleotidyltransferase domain-containing protein [Oscillospiraceae bacterium]